MECSFITELCDADVPCELREIITIADIDEHLTFVGCPNGAGGRNECDAV